MSKIKLSIIVVSYNSADYIQKCLDSILSQTIKEIEIIVVDDCSNDNTVEILNEYAIKDSRIKVIGLDSNVKPGGARNRGILAANGEYIGFVDSDDFVDNDYFKNLYNTAIKYNAEIAVAGIVKHKKYLTKTLVKYSRENFVTDLRIKIKTCFDTSKNFFYVFNKIYKKNLFQSYDLKFPEGQFYEDILFSIKALYYSDSLVSVPQVFYHYNQRANSIINSGKNKNTKIKDKAIAYQQLQMFCFEHKIELPEHLNYYTVSWYNPFIKTGIGLKKKKELLFGFLKIKCCDIDYTYPVDLVYLWVDGNDLQWQQKKNYWLHGSSNLNFQAVDKGRFVDNQELKYSLRAVEEYMPWINRIYIVTDNQIPDWLATSNPKIKVVFHNQFIPQESLPLFNSEAIESYLAKIPELSTHFIYANDDMYCNRYIGKEFFFDAEGLPIVRLKHQIPFKNLPTSMYARSILNLQNIIKDKFGVLYPYAPHHNFDAYNVYDFANCIDLFKDRWNLLRTHKFRTEGDINRVLITYYSLAVKRARLKRYSRVDRYFSVIKRLVCKFKRAYYADSIVISMKNKNPYAKLKKYNPALFCTNDGEGISDFDRQRIKIFLEETFPKKSSFEQ